MTEEPHEQLRAALLEPNVGIAFAWEHKALNALDLGPAQLCRGPLYRFQTGIGKALHALEVKRDGCSAWPSTLISNSTGYARLMDRLYVPIPRDRVTTIAVFDACASAYDLLIDAERNIRNISRLLNVIEAGSPSRDAVLRVLDFGCGTGLSLQAVARQARPWRFRLVGLDASPHMRAIAGSRGLEVVMGDEVQAYDGVFASYVLHGVLGPYDLRWIASVLSDKGVFAGNWLHGDDNVMQSFLEALGRRRQGRGATLKDPALWPRDPMITFLVDEG